MLESEILIAELWRQRLVYVFRDSESGVTFQLVEKNVVIRSAKDNNGNSMSIEITVASIEAFLEFYNDFVMTPVPSWSEKPKSQETFCERQPARQRFSWATNKKADKILVEIVGDYPGDNASWEDVAKRLQERLGTTNDKLPSAKACQRRYGMLAKKRVNKFSWADNPKADEDLLALTQDGRELSWAEIARMIQNDHNSGHPFPTAQACSARAWGLRKRNKREGSK